MTEDDVRQSLHLESADLVVSPVPEDLLRRGHRSLHARRAWAVGGTAAAAAIVVGVSWYAASDARDDDSTAPATAPLAPVTGTGEANRAPSPVISVGQWEPGDPSLRALVGGVVTMDSNGCVYLRNADHTTDVIWPAGYTAETSPGVPLLIRDAAGDVVAGLGTQINSGGGSVPALGTLACRAGTGDAVVIQSDPIVINGLAPQNSPLSRHEQRLVDAFISFAGAPSPKTLADVPFASEVALGMSDQILLRRGSGELSDASTWVLPIDSFDGLTGPFSALRQLAEATGPVEVSTGEHQHCAGPPLTLPPELAGLRQISIQPHDAAMCIQWWSVDLFLADGGDIRAVTVDYMGP